jgi:predicted DCC family thiol-disulfide oxidoreductase YuxK
LLKQVKVIMSTSNGIILFDGVCNLCNASINYVIDRDKQKYFRYAALQSKSGETYLNKFNMPADVFNTIVLVEGDKFYTRSTAALRIAKKMDGAWPLLYTFIIIPTFIRNVVYDFVAKNRYKWFGREETCRIPTPELKSLFLD